MTKSKKITGRASIVIGKVTDSSPIEDEIIYESDFSEEESNSEENTIKENVLNEKIDNKKSNNTVIYTLCGIVFVVVAVVLTDTYVVSSSTFSPEQKITIKELQKTFPEQPKSTWRTLEYVIDDVLKVEPIHPAVFLFIYKQENPDRLIDVIARYASGKLDVDHDHITIDENNYKSPQVEKDFGYLIEKYKPELEKKKIMVIKNINKMSGNTAQALHSFCDEITPLVDRAVYILTLQVDGYEGNELHTAERSLYQFWDDLKMDKLAPLITRVTSSVIKIN